MVFASSNWESFGASTVTTAGHDQRVISGGGAAVEHPTLPATLGGLELSLSAVPVCYDAATNGTTFTRLGIVTNTATSDGSVTEDRRNRTDSGCVTLTLDAPVLLDRDTSVVGFVNFTSASGDLIVGSMSYTLAPAAPGHVTASSMSGPDNSAVLAPS